MGGAVSSRIKHTSEEQEEGKVIHDVWESSADDDGIACSQHGENDEGKHALLSVDKAPKSDDICYLILKALKGKFIFESLNKNQLNDVIDVFVPVQCSVGEIIIQQGEYGEFMYVVEEGLFEVTQEGAEDKLGVCGKGSVFGELALLYNDKRSATITCIETASLWRLDRRSFKYYHTSNVKRASQFIMDILGNIPLFKGLSVVDLARITEVARPMKFSPGEFIIKKGDIGDSFYVIMEGIVFCHEGDIPEQTTSASTSNVTSVTTTPTSSSSASLSAQSTNLFDEEMVGTRISRRMSSTSSIGSHISSSFPAGGNRLKAGDWFGEIALLSSTSVRTANVVSESPLQLLAFDRDAFENILGNLKDLMEKRSNNRMLSLLPIIQRLPEQRRTHAVNMFHIEKFNKGETIAYCGDINPKLIVIKSGEACVWYHPQSGHKVDATTSDTLASSAPSKPPGEGITTDSVPTITPTIKDSPSLAARAFKRSNSRISLLSLDDHTHDIYKHHNEHEHYSRDVANVCFSSDHRFNGVQHKEPSMMITNRVVTDNSLRKDRISEKSIESDKYSDDQSQILTITDRNEERVREEMPKIEQALVDEPADPPPDIDHRRMTELFEKRTSTLRKYRCRDIYEESSLDSFDMSSGITESVLRSKTDWRTRLESFHMNKQLSGEDTTQRSNTEVGRGRDIDDDDDDDDGKAKQSTAVSIDMLPKGSIDIVHQEYEGVLEAGDCVGEEPIYHGTPMDCSVIANGNVTCYVLAQTDYIRLVSENETTESMEATDISKFVLVTRETLSGESYIEKNRECKKSVHWENLMKLYELGSGGFGKVYLMQDQIDDAKYALKVISSKSKKGSSNEHRIINEIDVLKQMNSPYICKLHAHASHAEHYYLLLEFIARGELRSLIRPKDKDKKLKQRQIIAEGKLAGMPHQAAKFYIATISLPLVYLHRRGIAYRDLKPGNIMIDRFGYPKLVDFGLSKRIDAIGKTFTLCGTTEYMAPEIIKGGGHNQAVDWWALGVLLYLMIVGATPFVQNNIPRNQQEKIEIFERIVKGRVNFPDDMEEGCKLLIRRLLNNKPVYRMGCGRRGNLEFEDHEWFEGEVDWVSLNLRQMKPPWVPTFKSELPDLSQTAENDQLAESLK